MIHPGDEESTRLENELIMCCARVTLPPQVAARIETLVAEPLDWDLVLSRSWWHRIRPLTYRHLRDLGENVVPDQVLMELARHAAELSIRNRRLAKALSDVASIFEDAGLRAAVFKGPTLAQSAYGDLTLRECGDLDLLIHPDDFSQVESVLRTHGFDSVWDHGKSNRQVFACDFRRSDASLDVHWHLAPGWLNYRVDFESLWSRGTPINENGDRFRKLAPEDSLVVLSIHGTKHWWERLRWICDVAELLNRGLIRDWSQVDASAHAANASRTVYLGLWLARNLLSSELPEDVSTRLGQIPSMPRLGSQVQNWLEHAERGDEARKLGERFLFRMGICERLRDRVPQVVHYLIARPLSHAE